MLRNVGTTSLKLIHKVNLKLLGALVCVSAPLIYAALFYLSKLTARIIFNTRLFSAGIYRWATRINKNIPVPKPIKSGNQAAIMGESTFASPSALVTEPNK